MRAFAPLAIFQAGARRLVRAPLLFVALWLPALLVTYASGRTMSLDYIDIWTNDGALDWPFIVVTPIWLVLSSFLAGGVLSRYAHPERTGTTSFLADCRAYAGTMLRLTLFSVAFTDLSYRFLEPALESIHGDVATVALFVIRFLVQICIQIAAVRTVVEDRRSVLFALAAAWRLFAARPVTVLALYALVALTMLVWLLPVVLALTIGGDAAKPMPFWAWNQVLTTARLWFDLLTAAALVALYEAEMARGSSVHDPAATSRGRLSGLDALTAKE